MKQKTPGKCSKHGKPLIMYCDEKECQTLLCTTCIVTKHHKHNLVDIPQKAEEMKKCLVGTNENNKRLKDAFDNQIKILNGAVEDINKTASKALDDLDERRATLCQQVNEVIDAHRAKVMQEQQEQLEKVTDVVKDITTKRAGIEQDVNLAEQVLNCDNPNDVIHNSALIVSNIREPETKLTYKTISFLSIRDDNFKHKILGQLDKRVKKVNLQGLCTQGIPIQGTLIKSWQVDQGYTIASDRDGNIYEASCDGKRSQYLNSFDLDGNVKMSVDIGSTGYLLAGIIQTYINGQSILVLSKNNCIEIRSANNGQEICSTAVGFWSGANAICETHDNKILMCDDAYDPRLMPNEQQATVTEFQVRNMKIEETKKSLSIPLCYVKGLCHVIHDNRQLVIATSHIGTCRAVVAVDYDTGEVVWKTDKPTCEGINMWPRGITSDGQGHLFVSDYLNKRVCVMTPDGKVHHTLLRNENAKHFWHQTWMAGHRKLVVSDYCNRIYVYDIKYQMKSPSVSRIALLCVLILLVFLTYVLLQILA